MSQPPPPPRGGYSDEHAPSQAAPGVKKRVRHGGAAVPQNDQLTPFLRAQLMVKEYQLIREAAEGILRGIYVQPSQRGAFREWVGSIFIRTKSPYAGGLFRFVITFPKRYPYEEPVAHFTTPVFHPQVGQDGSVDLGDWFNRETVRPFRSNIAQELLQRLKGMFFLENIKVRSAPKNHDANLLLKSQLDSENKDFKPFDQKVEEIVSESDLKKFSQSARHPHAMRFLDVSQEFARKVTDALEGFYTQGEGAETRDILDFFQENLVPFSAAMHGRGVD